jgi:hypothetical protein
MVLGRFREWGEERARQGRISELKSRLNEAGQISVEDMNSLLEDPSLEEVYKDKILQIGNRPDVRENLPVRRVYEYPKVKEPPSQEQIREKLKPLSEEEVIQRRDEFVEELGNGFPVMMFAYGHNNRMNQRFEHKEEFPNSQLMGQNPNAESHVYLDKLIRTYRAAAHVFAEADFDRITSHQVYFPSDKTETFVIAPDADFEWLDSMTDDFKGSNRENGFYMRERIAYIAESDAYRESHGLNPAQMQVDIVNQELVNKQSVPTEAYQVIDIWMQSARTGGGRRRGYMQFSIILGRTNRAIAQMKHEGPAKKDHRYAYYMEALANNPGFFLEAIRKFLPEIMSHKLNEDVFYGTTDQPVSIQIDIPELQAVDVPRKTTFRQIKE